MGCILEVPLTETFCYFCSLLFRSCGILSFYGHLLDNYCLYIPWLLGCESHSCCNCEISSFGRRICFPCRLLVIVFVCCCTHLCRLQICLLYPLDRWWRVDNTPLGTPRGRYDEHSSKSSLSCETKVYRTSRRKPNFRRLMLTRFARAPDNLYGALSRALLCTSSNVKPSHNTTKNFALTYDEVVNLTGLL
jgi:hypothetical protein